MSKKLRALSLLLVLVMAFGLFAGCSKDEQQPADDGDQPSNGGDANQGDQPSSDGGKDSIIIATANETPSLSPVEHNAVAGDYMNGLTYATLFRSNLDTLEPEPYLVDTYESVSDTEWQFKLKEGVKYHNGETMTAEDVKASIDLQDYDRRPGRHAAEQPEPPWQRHCAESSDRQQPRFQHRSCRRRPL